MASVFAFIKAIPAIIGLMKELLGFVHDIADTWERAQKVKELKEAVKDARDTKDTSKLENIFNPKP